MNELIRRYVVALIRAAEDADEKASRGYVIRITIPRDVMMQVIDFGQSNKVPGWRVSLLPKGKGTLVECTAAGSEAIRSFFRSKFPTKMVWADLYGGI